MTFLRNLLTLGRISNLPTVWTNCLAAWTVNAFASSIVRQMPNPIKDLSLLAWEQLGWLLIGASLIYVAGCTLNDAFDQGFDEKHNPQRPIPSGEMKPVSVWLVGFAELIAGSFVLLDFAEVSEVWLIALTLAILTYEAVHKKWFGAVWLMGSCRFFLWLAAASAANESLAPLTIAWAGIVAIYVVGISLFARGEATGESRENRLPVPLLFGTPLFALALLVYWNNLPTTAQFATHVAGLISVWLAYTAVKRMRTGEAGCIGQGVSRLLAGISACDATAIGLVSPSLAYGCLACIPIAFLMQKKFAAT
ncbi:MAG: hypothetical protein CMI26_04640 [Opitutae bacterium]|jgi:4-hydroxybenzoate polyprenyltransferase|nr:hypothetical protein [Opitutae bacterium]|tara:strand:- start:1838 stop:2761 length:924 start_codon:yes stop_codon:yes gene_type:complete